MKKTSPVWKSVVVVLAVIGLVALLGFVGMTIMHFCMMGWSGMR